MSIISLTPEQHELLVSGGMERFFSPMTTENMYEIIPLHAQEGYDEDICQYCYDREQREHDEDICQYCYDREQREHALSAALHVPVRCLQELFDNAEKIQKWVEGDI